MVRTFLNDEKYLLAKALQLRFQTNVMLALVMLSVKCDHIIASFPGSLQLRRGESSRFYHATMVQRLHCKVRPV